MAALREAYERAADSTAPGPQIVAIVADSGFGKTRLVQEFYNWLSTEKDGVGQAGYWPDHLRRGRSLEINPDVADTNSSIPMPFLWWAVRYLDPLKRNSPTYISQLNTGAEIFVPHLEQMYLERRKSSRGKEGQKIFRDFAVETGMEMLSSIIPGISLLRAGKEAAFAFAQLRVEREEDRALKPSEKRESHRRSLGEEYLQCLSHLFNKKHDDENTIPFVFVVDDAQWSDGDSPLLWFIDALLKHSMEQGWPVLLVVTCWRAEWNQIPAIRRVIESYAADTWLPVVLHRHPDLSACVKSAFPGMPPDQINLVAEKADGNPLFLNEIIREIGANRKYFVGRDIGNALEPSEFAKLSTQTFDLYKLARNRLSALPEVEETLALSGFQGTRFLASLSQEVLTALHRQWSASNALASAENPHSFIDWLNADTAEFSQRIYYEVALSCLPNVADANDIREILARSITERLESLQGPDDDLLANADLFDVTFEIFSNDSDPERRLLACRALIYTGDISEQRGDLELAEKAYLNSLAITKALAADEDMPQAQRFLAVGLGRIGRIIEARGQVDAAEEAYRESADIHRRLVQQLDTTLSRFELSAALVRVGGVQWLRGALNRAEMTFYESLLISREVVSELETERTWRQLATSLNCFGDVSRELGKLEVSQDAYDEALNISRVLAEKDDSSPLRQELAIALNRFGDREMARGSLTQAEEYYREALQIMRQLDETPRMRRAVSLFLCDIGRVADARGDFDSAEEAFQEALEIAREVAAGLDTLEARRELAWLLTNIGSFNKRRGDLESAESTYREALEIARDRARILGTPGAREDVSVLLCGIGNIAAERGDLNGAELGYREALEFIRAVIADIGVRQVRDTFVLCLGCVGRVWQMRGDLPAAEGAYTEALQIFHAGDNIDVELNLLATVSPILDCLGILEQTRGHLEAALEVYKESIEVKRGIVARVGTPDSKHELSLSLARLAEVWLAREEPINAVTLYREALDIARELVAQRPTPRAWRELSGILDRLGSIAKATGDLEYAGDAYRESLEIDRLFPPELGTSR